MPSTQSQKRARNDAPPRIDTEEEYELAIAKIESLWDALDGTSDAEARDFLVDLVEEYETRHEDFG